MKTKVLLLATLLTVGSQSVMGETSSFKGGTRSTVASQDLTQDGFDAVNRLAGVFQRYEPNRNLVRISDVDYELDPSLALRGSKLREFKNGQAILFTQAGVSDAGRNVVTAIEPR